MLERILFIVAGFFAGLLLAQSPLLTPQKQDRQLEQNEAPKTAVQAPAQKTTVSSSKEIGTSAKSNEDIALVTSVHDGDTITVMYKGVQTKVRLIGINAPEIYNNQKIAQCFGHEATEYARALLEKQTVRIETDPSQETHDKYGRLLAYAFLPDGKNVAQVMIGEGYAYEYTYRLPYRYQSAFKAAQKVAKENELGLWKSGVCAQ